MITGDWELTAKRCKIEDIHRALEIEFSKHTLRYRWPITSSQSRVRRLFAHVARTGEEPLGRARGRRTAAAVPRDALVGVG